MTTKQLGFSLALFSLVACNNHKNNKKDILASNIDTTVRPQDDFFQYANGTWLKNNPIPAAYSSWGIANLVQDDLNERLRKINEQAVKNPDNALSKKIAAFWASGMDTVAFATQDIAILKPYFEEINDIENISDLLKVSADFAKMGVGSLFSGGVSQDAKNSSVEAFYLYQGGIGLPNRDYYFNTDKRTVDIRNAYILHIKNMLALSGEDAVVANTASKNIFDVEKTLAAASRKLADLRDPYKNYNKFSVEALGKQTPNINWHNWLLNINAHNVDTVIVGQPEFFTALNNTLKTVPIDVWKQYMKWHLLSALGQYVNQDLDRENFAFSGVVMNGLKAQKPRWKRVLGMESGAMGEALGQLFVKEYFPEKAKKRYSDLVENIREALKERIEKLDWMSDSTKEKALYKLSKMKKKVGYPDKWKDFSAMEITQQPLVKNIIASRLWWHQYEIDKLGKPVNRDEWGMTPQTYNAYYNPSNNEIVLPAGIFTVPGYMDSELDDALVYGYAGASTIGHEITHGFDDQGRQFDAAGNLKNWWSKGDAEKFKKRAAVMIKQFDGYNPVDTSHINGSATLGENIADLGGVLLGWDAFKKSDAYKANKMIGGLTPAQRYFLGYALGWLYKIRPEKLAQQLLTDVHSPAKYRVNGPFSDVDAFYKTFGVKPGDKMYIADSARAHIW